MKFNILLFVQFLLVGCSTQVYRQAGSDTFSMPLPTGKAVAVLDAVADLNGTSGTMLVGYALFESGKSQNQLYKKPEWEFATYPGAIIPGFASKDPHSLHAYLLDPGLYVAVRCVYKAPEVDYCPEGYWTLNDTTLGMAYFEVTAGDVINTGQLQVLRNRDFSGSTYAVSVNNNQTEAKKYIERNWPSLANKLVYKPIQFKSW